MRKYLSILLLSILLAVALAACGGSSDEEPSGGQPDDSGAVSAGDPVEGKKQYDMVCIACHGPTGEGVENLGKPFTTSDFVTSQSDEELLAFVKTGRPIGHPDNTTGVDMPPKGGNPALTDEQLLDIIAYIRTLHE